MSDKKYYLEQISECEAKIASARAAIAKINAATQDAATSSNPQESVFGGMRRRKHQTRRHKHHTKRRHHSKRRRTVRRR